MEIQSHMTLGGGFTAAVLSPIHALGNQLNGRGIHDVNHPLEPEGELRPAARAKTRLESGKGLDEACQRAEIVRKRIRRGIGADRNAGRSVGLRVRWPALPLTLTIRT